MRCIRHSHTASAHACLVDRQHSKCTDLHSAYYGFVTAISGKNTVQTTVLTCLLGISSKKKKRLWGYTLNFHCSNIIHVSAHHFFLILCYFTWALILLLRQAFDCWRLLLQTFSWLSFVIFLYFSSFLPRCRATCPKLWKTACLPGNCTFALSQLENKEGRKGIGLGWGEDSVCCAPPKYV